MTSTQFGNPVWKSDDIDVTDDRKLGRQEGLDEALRIILGPSIMSNNTEFDTGVNCAVRLLQRRRAEL